MSEIKLTGHTIVKPYESLITVHLEIIIEKINESGILIRLVAKTI